MVGFFDFGEEIFEEMFFGDITGVEFVDFFMEAFDAEIVVRPCGLLGSHLVLLINVVWFYK